jgi:hypothetical protein
VQPVVLGLFTLFLRAAAAVSFFVFPPPRARAPLFPLARPLFVSRSFVSPSSYFRFQGQAKKTTEPMSWCALFLKKLQKTSKRSIAAATTATAPDRRCRSPLKRGFFECGDLLTCVR